MIEAQVEKPVVRWAKKNSIWAWKCTVPGWSGFPDRLFVFENGSLVFIEFKRPGKVATPLQELCIAKLRARGFTVHVVDDKDEGIRILREHKENLDTP